MGVILDGGKTLDRIQSTSYNDAFLIGDLLTTKTTFLTGEPKAGKTLFAAGMVIALLNGEESFLGLPIFRKVNKVVFGLSDDGAEEELKARLDGAVPLDSVTVFTAQDTKDSNYWAGVRDDLKTLGADLFVLDNVLGALAEGQDISSSTVAQTVALNLRVIAGSGVPVLAVTHSPKGAGEGLTVSSSVIGGRAIAAAGRGVVALRDSGKQGKRIQTRINRAREDLEIRVKVRRQNPDSEVPIWERVEDARDANEKKTRDRAAESGAKLQQLANLLVTTQPANIHSFNAAATNFAPEFGIGLDTARRRLGGFAHFDGERWQEGPKP